MRRLVKTGLLPIDCSRDFCHECTDLKDMFTRQCMESSKLMTDTKPKTMETIVENVRKSEQSCGNYKGIYIITNLLYHNNINTHKCNI